MMTEQTSKQTSKQDHSAARNKPAVKEVRVRSFGNAVESGAANSSRPNNRNKQHEPRPNKSKFKDKYDKNNKDDASFKAGKENFHKQKQVSKLREVDDFPPTKKVAESANSEKKKQNWGGRTGERNEKGNSPKAAKPFSRAAEKNEVREAAAEVKAELSNNFNQEQSGNSGERTSKPESKKNENLGKRRLPYNQDPNRKKSYDVQRKEALLDFVVPLGSAASVEEYMAENKRLEKEILLDIAALASVKL